jgi:hypothetical protein
VSTVFISHSHLDSVEATICATLGIGRITLYCYLADTAEKRLSP